MSRDMGFDSKPLAGKGKLGVRAILATYQAGYGALVSKLQDSGIVSALSRRKLTAFLSRLKASPQTPFRSKVLSLAARVDDGTADCPTTSDGRTGIAAVFKKFDRMAMRLDDAAAAASDAAEDAATFPAARGGGGGGGGGSLNPAKPDAKLLVKPDAKSPAVAKTVSFARNLPSRWPGAQG